MSGDNSWDDDKGSEGEKKPEKHEKKRERSSKHVQPDAPKLVMKELLTIDCPEISEVCTRLRNMFSSSSSVTPDAFFVELRMLQVSQDFDAKVNCECSALIAFGCHCLVLGFRVWMGGACVFVFALQCRMYVVFNALFKDGMTPEALEQRMPFVAKCCDSSVHAPDIISALENFCFENEATSMAGYPYLLQRMYNAEILEPEDILEYYKSERGDAVFEKCRVFADPFLKWLAEADSSDEE